MAGFRLINGKYVIEKNVVDPTTSHLDYGVNMAKWLLPGDSLAGGAAVPPVWTCSADMEVISSSVVGTAAMAYIEGGTLGKESWARVAWTTSQGRREAQTIYFVGVQK